jgi:hypothetical protein
VASDLRQGGRQEDCAILRRIKVGPAVHPGEADLEAALDLKTGPTGPTRGDLGRAAFAPVPRA